MSSTSRNVLERLLAVQHLVFRDVGQDVGLALQGGRTQAHDGRQEGPAAAAAAVSVEGLLELKALKGQRRGLYPCAGATAAH